MIINYYRKMKRACLDYKHDPKTVRKLQGDFTKQYNKIYYERLREQHPVVLNKARGTWLEKSPAFPNSIPELMPYKPAVICGTLFKVMAKKPDFLDTFKVNYDIYNTDSNEKLTSKSDYFLLEDFYGRIKLDFSGYTSNTPIDTLVTGFVVAVLGQGQSNGTFLVMDISGSCIVEKIETIQLQYPHIEQHTALSAAPMDNYMVLVSGFDFNKKQASTSLNNLDLSSILLVELLRGTLPGLPNNLLSKLERASKLVIAGNLTDKGVYETTELLEDAPITAADIRNKRTGIDNATCLFADQYLYVLASTIQTDFMPGAHDMTHKMWPQNPVNPCTLPNSQNLGTLRCVENPYAFEYHGKRILGTSGANITDMLTLSVSNSSLDLMEAMLTYEHIAPTAPDTLSCFPSFGHDPFVLTRDAPLPDLYFVGNSKSYQQRVVRVQRNKNDPTFTNTTLLCVPSFKDTKQLVLVNLNDMSSELITLP